MWKNPACPSFCQPTMPNANEAERPGGVQALETGLAVLDALVAQPQPMMLKDIAQAAGMHPAKVHRYLVSFARYGYVEQEASGRYALGRRALAVGLACLARIDAVRLATPLLDDLTRETGESMLAAVWGNLGPTVVQWRDASLPVTVNVRPGSVLPLLSSATGRVFTAFLDPEQTRKQVAAELRTHARAHPPRHPHTAEALAQMLAAIRHSRIGLVKGDLLAGVSSVSTPVFDHEGRLVLAISAVGNEATFDAAPDGATARAIKRGARALSQRLGYEGE